MNTDAISEFDQKLIQEASWLRPLLDNNFLPVTQEKLRSLIGNLEEELDKDDLCPEETSLKLNVKTWVYMKMDENDKALIINRRVIQLSDMRQGDMGHHEDLIALLLGASLCWKLGREMEARQYYHRIKQLTSPSGTEEIKATSKAGLAYVYSRLSNPRHLWESVRLFEEAIRVCPDQMYWKLRLGLGYRRLTQNDVFTGLVSTNLVEPDQLKDFFLKSFHILSKVIERKSENPLLVGPAYAELAYLCCCDKKKLSENEYMTIFGRRPLREKISKCIARAMEHGKTSPWVLTRCAILVKNSDVDKAIEMLETCLQIREHTTTFSYLGECFNIKSKSYIKEPDQEGEYLTKAKHAFKKAASLSHNTNLRALFNLGKLYMPLGRIDKAVILFNRICQSEHTGHILTIIYAFQLAALCYVEMRQDELAIDKLTKAIALSVTFYQTDSPQNLNRTSFNKIKATIKNTGISLFKNPSVCRVFQLVEHFQEARCVSPEIFREYGSLLDGNMIMGKLNLYLEQRKFERALAALTLLGIQKNVGSSELWTCDEMVNLKRKVLLAAAKFRMKRRVYHCQLVFRELFQLYQTRRSYDVPVVAASQSKTKDVLLLHDHLQETDHQPSRTSSTVVEFLLHIFREVFGLEVTESLQNSSTGWMQDHSLVLVVLLDKTRTDRYEAVLREIACTENQPLVLTQADFPTADIPESLRASRRFSCPSLADMTSLIHKLKYEEERLTEGQVDYIMELFCFLIGESNPIQ